MSKTDKIHITVQLWPVTSGYHWAVPHPTTGYTPLQLSSDLGTAARESRTLADQLYGDQLGSISFRVTDVI